MHNPDYAPSTGTTNNTTLFDGGSATTHTLPRVQFSAAQHSPADRKLSELIAEHTERQQFFYGIELTARSQSVDAPVVLDYNSFGPLLPLFTSLVWLSQDYWRIDRLQDVGAVRFATQLQPQTIVLPHFSCYRTDRERLKEFARLNFTNVLALRGDLVAPEQDYQHASDLVAAIRALRGDTMSIGVGGYPEGHPDAKSLQEDMDFLLQKVNAGADFIITQICFSSTSLIEFIRRCRANGITVPIIIGVFVPDNMHLLRRISQITQVQIPAEQLAEYKRRAKNTAAFHEYAEQQAVQLINEIFDSDLGIYGVQFFTMNKFQNVHAVVQKILENKHLKS